ncbi:glycosyltransferase WbsX family protein [Geomonas anaerohicana]|uniref:Glycoside hydrolase family 99-like domain-containing protein n=1 Tax=Geomonas anaerohicana TaxID=2798583 RepID=A0ABS0YH06_9BACT|nr:glycoside hydrolase family 99-like domain-containing protein [Geomonas anaerohicana]MBJ6751580.1 glycoside hydrolase family 99-like domain-containing protein [Geomonas anaerohicana]
MEKTPQQRKARVIGFYLPQFHPIPENNAWWGPGFTEWTNTAKAKPLFGGHVQPHLPADLGFYDLRVSETREAQAELAQEYGIEGFCYWHYWFAGKRLLERPFNEVLALGRPGLPFCLGWANDSWTGVWHGCPGRMLIEQTFPGPEDEKAHFEAMLPAFTDERYITVEGKPLFFVYNPPNLPDQRRFTDHWRELAVKAGLKGIYFVGNANTMRWVPEEHGFDAVVPHNPGFTTHWVFNKPPTKLDDFSMKLTGKNLKELWRGWFPTPNRMDYEEYIKIALAPLQRDNQFPCVVPNWDNTPRCGVRGYVLTGSTPELFRRHLRDAIAQVAERDPDKRIIFLKSWNEWAEGNYVEPDQEFGRGWLNACKQELVPGNE